MTKIPGCDIKNFFMKEELLKRTPEELSIFNMFWQNRYAKEVKSIYLAYFAIQQLDLWKKQPEDIKITDEILNNIITKYKVINTICIKHYNKVQEGNVDGKDNHSIDIEKQWPEDYMKYFKGKIPKEKNDLVKDIEECFNGCMAPRNIYAIKTNLVCGEIIQLIESKKIRNWGYIEEGKDNLEKDEKFVLIGIDLTGYNMPVRIHIPKDVLIDRLQEVTKQCVIPIYDGANDFKLNGDVISTNLLLPLQKSQKDFLRKVGVKPKGAFNKEFLEHVVFLSNSDKFPDHLKKKQDGKKVRVREYIDLTTGRKYTKLKEKYIEKKDGESVEYGR